MAGTVTGAGEVGYFVMLEARCFQTVDKGIVHQPFCLFGILFPLSTFHFPP